jgi:hypothetical protein
MPGEKVLGNMGQTMNKLSKTLFIICYDEKV